MLCCFQDSISEPPSSSLHHETPTVNTTTNYPGQRRYVKTGGNALAAAPPSMEPSQGTATHSYSHARAISVPTSANTEGELISVTVPEGVTGGQTLHVTSPDGSGRLIKAQVPMGLRPGAVFYVRAPPKSHSASIVASSSPAISAMPLPPPPMSPSYIPPHEAHPHSQIPMASARPIPMDYNNASGGVPSSSATKPFANSLDDPVETRQPRNTFASTTSSQPTSLLKVTVPPGVAPGSTLHVQVPGENRLIEARVPPNCREFHVEYTPRGNSNSSAPSAMSFSTQQQPSTWFPQGESNHHQQQQQQQQQRLLLVKVPPGTLPGTTLHVQVPNEPGRLISAQVPPGNVREFHVSYQPRNAAAAGYHQQPTQTQTQPQHHASTSHHYYKPNNQNSNNNYSNNNNNNNDWTPSASLPMVAGGIATGIAGAMVYDHFAHHVNSS